MPALMDQGFCGLLLEPCGTDGVGICVGVAYKVGGPREWFVAHINCLAQVSGPRTPIYAAVRRWVRVRMNEVAGAFAPGSPLYLVSSGSDFSTYAIRDGLAEWAGGEALQLTQWDGFKIVNGVLSPLEGAAGNTRGEPFTVPARP